MLRFNALCHSSSTDSMHWTGSFSCRLWVFGAGSPTNVSLENLVKLHKNHGWYAITNSLQQNQNDAVNYEQNRIPARFEKRGLRLITVEGMSHETMVI